MGMRFEAKKKPAEVRRQTPAGKIVAVLALLLLVAGSIWGVRESMESRRAAANLAEFQQMREQLKSDAFKDMTREERRELFREKWNKLTFEQRKKLSNEGAAEEKKRYDEYINAPEDQRPAILDRQMEEMRKRWKGKGPGGGGKSNNPAGGTQGNGTPPSSNQAAMRGEQGRRERLDMTTPEQRAQRSVYRQAMRQQMQQGGR